MITRKVAPAIAAGCTIVLKPAEQTPLCAIEMFRIFERRVPARRRQPAHHQPPGRVGEELLASPAVRKLTFTGSTEVGRCSPARAAATMKRVSLELGGHAPFIAFEDADSPRRQGRRAGEVPQHRPGVHLPQPHLRPPLTAR